MILDLQNSFTWKIQLTIAINFISSKDVQEDHVMHSRSSNTKFASYNDTNEVVDKLFESLHSKYEQNLKTSMRGSDFIFDSVQMMYYKCCKVNFRRGSSYIYYPHWMKKKNSSNKSKK